MSDESQNPRATPQTDIVLLAINAKYRHTAFGLRCLLANMGDLATHTVLLETTIQQQAMEIVERVLSHAPKIVGIGVYIWNVELCERVARILRQLHPDIVLVLGGPEVSHETDQQTIVQVSDYVICGEGEEAFRTLCETLADNQRPTNKRISGTTPDMEQLVPPYHLYTDEDIQNRVVYVEASRGCPYRCQFCLSALDKKVRTVNAERFFDDLDHLLSRGAKDFKFIDRTFNLRIDFSLQILNFFLDRLQAGLTLHFEMVPDRLPTELKQTLERFPAGIVQLEIGVQTLDPAVGKRIDRPMNWERIRENLQHLRQNTQMYLHVDLIVGLPGETMNGFGTGFDQLVAPKPHEIQVGILKRLKGTPITKHDGEFGMIYNPLPPFDVLCTSAMSFPELQEMKRFARYWDLVANRANFRDTAPMIWQDQPSAFQAFRAFSDWLYQRVGRTHHINLMRLAEALLDYLTDVRGFVEADVAPQLVADLNRTGGRRFPPRLRRFQSPKSTRAAKSSRDSGLARQQRHQQ